MKRYASIDIGTNTVLMAIADVADDGRIYPVYDGQQLPRLGKDVESNKIIREDSIRRVIDVLKTFKKTAESYEVFQILACGTSALRDAENRDMVVQQIKAETDIDVDIISGDTEAEYTYLGALTGLSLIPATTGVLDIGGGSTELVAGRGESLVSRCSIDVGSVRLTEIFFQSLPPSPRLLYEAQEYVRNTVRQQIEEFKIKTLIGVAGTVTTLAAIQKKLPAFSADLIHGYVLGSKDIESMYAQFSGYSLDQMIKVPQISRGREDILLAGILILRVYLSLLGKQDIIVSTRGLRYGQILVKKART